MPRPPTNPLSADARGPRSSGAPAPRRSTRIGADAQRFAERETHRLLAGPALSVAIAVGAIGAGAGAWMGLQLLYGGPAYGDLKLGFGAALSLIGLAVFGAALVISNRAAWREFRSGGFSELAVTPTRPEDVAAGKIIGAFRAALLIAAATLPGIVLLAGGAGRHPIAAVAGLLGMAPAAALGAALGTGSAVRRLAKWYVLATGIVLLVWVMFALIYMNLGSRTAVSVLWPLLIIGHPMAVAVSTTLGPIAWIPSIVWSSSVAYIFAHGAANAVTSQDIAEEIATAQPIMRRGRDRPWFVPPRMGYKRPRVVFEDANPRLTYERAFGWIPSWGVWHVIVIEIAVVVCGAPFIALKPGGTAVSEWMILLCAPLLLQSIVVPAFSMAWGLRKHFDAGTWEELHLTRLTPREHVEALVRPALDGVAFAIVGVGLIAVAAFSFGQIPLVACVCIIVIAAAEPLGRVTLVAATYPREGAASNPTLYTFAVTVPFYLLSVLASPNWPTKWLAVLSPPGAIYLGTTPGLGFWEGPVVLVAAAVLQVAFAAVVGGIVLRRIRPW